MTVAPDFAGTAAEFIQRLQDDPHEWIIGGVLGGPDGSDDPSADTTA